jgi:hypothetical protein
MFGTMTGLSDVAYRSNLYLMRVSETGLRLRSQVKHTNLGPVCRATFCLRRQEFFPEKGDTVRYPNGRLSKP